MANTYAPSGFAQAKNYGGSAPNYAVRGAKIAYNLSNKIAYGDPVILNSSGLIDIYASGGTTIHGIFVGCNYFDPNINQTQFRPAWTAPGSLTSSQTVDAFVVVDPDALFLVQVSGTAVAQGSIGKNIDLVASGTGVAGAPNLAGISTAALLSSSIATTNTLPFRIVGIPTSGFNYLYSPTAANNFVEVKMNNSDILQTTGI